MIFPVKKVFMLDVLMMLIIVHLSLIQKQFIWANLFPSKHPCSWFLVTFIVPWQSSSTMSLNYQLFFFAFVSNPVIPHWVGACSVSSFSLRGIYLWSIIPILWNSHVHLHFPGLKMNKNVMIQQNITNYCPKPTVSAVVGYSTGDLL